MPPGVVPIGHFREKTAILSVWVGLGYTVLENGRRFHANSTLRRSPDHGLVKVDKVVQMEEVVGVWRRKRVGMVKRTMKKRVVHKLD